MQTAMNLPARKPNATYADLEALPEHIVGELIDGVLYTQSRPRPRHQFSSAALTFDLLKAFDRRRGGAGGWWFLQEPELHFGKDVLIPDLAGWRTESMPSLPESHAITIVPAWVCEVLSPSTKSHDRIRKLRVYAREGVKHVWLVDPGEKSLEVYRREGDHWVLAASFEEDELAHAEPFDSMNIDLALWWPEE